MYNSIQESIPNIDFCISQLPPALAGGTINVQERALAQQWTSIYNQFKIG